MAQTRREEHRHQGSLSWVFAPKYKSPVSPDYLVKHGSLHCMRGDSLKGVITDSHLGLVRFSKPKENKEYEMEPQKRIQTSKSRLRKSRRLGIS